MFQAARIQRLEVDARSVAYWRDTTKTVFADAIKVH